MNGQDFWEDLFRGAGIKLGSDSLRDPEGDVIKFDLKPGQNTYRWWAPPKNHPKSQYCFAWTPHKDVKGWYWTFTMVPVGKGSRTGKATSWEKKNHVRFRKRKDAKQRAADRFNKAVAK